MADQSNGSHRFEVHCSGLVDASIREIHAQATSEGRGESVTRAFRQIILRLERDPFEVGEPTYRLATLRMQIRRTVVVPLAVHFGIMEDHALVLIKTVTLLPPPRKK